MFDGRHCTKEDLDLLTRETKNIKIFILDNSHEEKECVISYQIKRYLSIIGRFDNDIMCKLEMKIEIAKNDYEKIIRIIDEYYDILKQNVIVDINEHQ